MAIGDLPQRCSGGQTILKTETCIFKKELLRYVLLLPFCPKAVTGTNAVVLVCTGVTAEKPTIPSKAFVPEPLFSWYCWSRCQRGTNRSALAVLQALKVG